ncbi:hypothetical protein [Gleimia europaea]|uniref:Uncharacterized protein n=1 Tax=Gleimia europaea ACS-120-V-Col10b TaxID=883069 RepID=A0A9W5REC4_9ACTO|nr:hypothetical protein [Gleimia europaea]EPD30894.1 hypothetical protein HMPREF9238_00649 [Gleimia europaea ACS-120-V-Col10b]
MRRGGKRQYRRWKPNAPACQIAARGAGEDGRITLLVLGLALLVVAVVLVSIAATTVHVQRRQLLSCADWVALSVAGSTSAADYYENGSAHVTQAGVSDRAASVFNQLRTTSCKVGSDAWIESATASAGEARVELAMNPQMPVFGSVLDFINQPLTVRVVASAKLH